MSTLSVATVQTANISAYNTTSNTSLTTGNTTAGGLVTALYTGGVVIQSNSSTNAINISATGDTTINGNTAVTIPTGNVAQRPSGITGMLRLNTDISRFEGYNGSNWGSLGGATGGGVDDAFYENTNTITTNYTITTGKNAMTGGPVTINSGIVVTVPSGSYWTVV